MINIIIKVGIKRGLYLIFTIDCTSIILYINITKNEIKALIAAAYIPITLIKDKFIMIFSIADNNDVLVISFVFFFAIYIAPKNETKISKNIPINNIGM